MSYSPSSAAQNEDLKPEVIVEIDEQGNFSLDVLNGDGHSCRGLTSELEDFLGTVTDRQVKPEADRAQPASQAIRRKNLAAG